MLKQRPIKPDFASLNASEPQKRTGALLALSTLQFTTRLRPMTDRKVTKAFINAIKDPSLPVKTAAMYALAMNNCGGREGLEILFSAIKKDGAQMSIDQLSRIIGCMCGCNCGMEMVGRMLSDKKYPQEARSVAAMQLGNAKKNAGAARACLEQLVDDPETSVSVFSRMSLSDLNKSEKTIRA